MEINYRHCNTPSSRRFHNIFTLSTTTTNSSTTDNSADELTEADLFSLSSDSTRSPVSRRNSNNLGFKSGILAALPDDSVDGFSTAATATPFRAIPKPPQQQRVNSEWTQSVPCRKFHQHSAPVNVPMMMKKPKKFGELDDYPENEDEDEDEEEMLPPHEIVAMKLKSTSSVLEGVGRTLKGRDLRQVRNAVWSKTGFLD